ncbi:MAG TPA: isoprenylcysteine carboxylmethyltransferase family protein, partial [Nitrospiria bacterium]
MILLKLAKKTRIVLGGAFALILIAIACPTPASLVAGFPVVLMGESIRTWSSGYIRKNKALATDGPYAHTRNPLYLGSFLIGLGFVAMSRSLWGLAIYLAAYTVIYRAVIRYEENDLARVFGGEFADYVRTVPRFI